MLLNTIYAIIGHRVPQTPGGEQKPLLSEDPELHAGQPEADCYDFPKAATREPAKRPTKAGKSGFYISGRLTVLSTESSSGATKLS
ncbi:Hypothetical protein SMAX5B_020018 [Scophthalmus maximus]|uniref:Uncharacterized protein n=1 Tax=Scophthalmus maximus TaxID=52904 RepID=A0A2U9B9W3_SCOMX|nr:Hypothetical protein SMAX5B_020018 [Scophthalmus maximus]